MSWERVVTINDFYDEPRRGFAFLDGRLHVYRSIFDEAQDEYSEEFSLTPVDEALLPLIEEAWTMWIRWATAFHAGDESLDTHPALPVDRPRSDELEAVLAPVLAAHSEKSVRRLAEFRNVDIIGWKQDVEVRWSLPNERK